MKYSGLTWSEIAFDVCSGGGGSDAGIPLALSARKGTRLVYFSIYASRVTMDPEQEIKLDVAQKTDMPICQASGGDSPHPSNHA